MDSDQENLEEAIVLLDALGKKSTSTTSRSFVSHIFHPTRQKEDKLSPFLALDGENHSLTQLCIEDISLLHPDQKPDALIQSLASAHKNRFRTTELDTHILGDIIVPSCSSLAEAIGFDPSEEYITPEKLAGFFRTLTSHKSVLSTLIGTDYPSQILGPSKNESLNDLLARRFDIRDIETNLPFTDVYLSSLFEYLEILSQDKNGDIRCVGAVPLGYYTNNPKAIEALKKELDEKKIKVNDTEFALPNFLKIISLLERQRTHYHHYTTHMDLAISMQEQGEDKFEVYLELTGLFKEILNENPMFFHSGHLNASNEDIEGLDLDHLYDLIKEYTLLNEQEVKGEIEITEKYKKQTGILLELSDFCLDDWKNKTSKTPEEFADYLNVDRDNIRIRLARMMNQEEIQLSDLGPVMQTIHIMDELGYPSEIDGRSSEDIWNLLTDIDRKYLFGIKVYNITTGETGAVKSVDFHIKNSDIEKFLTSDSLTNERESARILFELNTSPKEVDGSLEKLISDRAEAYGVAPVTIFKPFHLETEQKTHHGYASSDLVENKKGIETIHSQLKKAGIYSKIKLDLIIRETIESGSLQEQEGFFSLEDLANELKCDLKTAKAIIENTETKHKTKVEKRSSVLSTAFSRLDESDKKEFSEYAAAEQFYAQHLAQEEPIRIAVENSELYSLNLTEVRETVLMSAEQAGQELFQEPLSLDETIVREASTDHNNHNRISIGSFLIDGKTTYFKSDITGLNRSMNNKNLYEIHLYHLLQQRFSQDYTPETLTKQQAIEKLKTDNNDIQELRKMGYLNFQDQRIVEAAQQTSRLFKKVKPKQVFDQGKAHIRRYFKEKEIKTIPQTAIERINREAMDYDSALKTIFGFSSVPKDVLGDLEELITNHDKSGVLNSIQSTLTSVTLNKQTRYLRQNVLAAKTKAQGPQYHQLIADIVTDRVAQDVSILTKTQAIEELCQELEVKQQKIQGYIQKGVLKTGAANLAAEVLKIADTKFHGVPLTEDRIRESCSRNPTLQKPASRNTIANKDEFLSYLNPIEELTDELYNGFELVVRMAQDYLAENYEKLPLVKHKGKLHFYQKTPTVEDPLFYSKDKETLVGKLNGIPLTTRKKYLIEELGCEESHFKKVSSSFTCLESGTLLDKKGAEQLQEELTAFEKTLHDPRSLADLLNSKYIPSQELFSKIVKQAANTLESRLFYNQACEDDALAIIDGMESAAENHNTSARDIFVFMDKDYAYFSPNKTLNIEGKRILADSLTEEHVKKFGQQAYEAVKSKIFTYHDQKRFFIEDVKEVIRDVTYLTVLGLCAQIDFENHEQIEGKVYYLIRQMGIDPDKHFDSDNDSKYLTKQETERIKLALDCLRSSRLGLASQNFINRTSVRNPENSYYTQKEAAQILGTYDLPEPMIECSELHLYSAQQLSQEVKKNAVNSEPLEDLASYEILLLSAERSNLITSSDRQRAAQVILKISPGMYDTLRRTTHQKLNNSD